MKLLELHSNADFYKAIWKGDIKEIKHQSNILKNNTYNDSCTRSHFAYVPRSVAQKKDTKIPIIYGLPTYGRTAKQFFVPERIDKISIVSRINKLIEQGMNECIFVALDCMTSLGGNQYTNGASGNYADYIVHEAIPKIESELNASLNIGQRSILGTSSGGYGSLFLSLNYPNYFSAVACHSGDVGFEYSYIPEIPLLINRLDANTQSDDQKLLNIIEKYHKIKQHTPSVMHDLVLLGAAASYSPEKSSKVGFKMPFDLYTGKINENIWAKWIEMDLINLVENLGGNLRSLKMVFIDCGNRDQYGSHLGARQLSSLLNKKNINHIYEEFNGTHTDIEYRYEYSMPKLVNAMQK